MTKAEFQDRLNALVDEAQAAGLTIVDVLEQVEEFLRSVAAEANVILADTEPR